MRARALVALALSMAPIGGVLDRVYPGAAWVVLFWLGVLVWVAALNAALGYAVGITFRDPYTGAVCGCLLTALFWPVAFVVYGAAAGSL